MQKERACDQHCVANLNGECVAVECRGAITGLDISATEPEKVAMLYVMALACFDELFDEDTSGQK